MLLYIFINFFEDFSRNAFILSSKRLSRQIINATNNDIGQNIDKNNLKNKDSFIPSYKNNIKTKWMLYCFFKTKFKLKSIKS